MAVVPIPKGQQVSSRGLPDAPLPSSAFGAGVSQGLGGAAQALAATAQLAQAEEDQRSRTRLMQADTEWMAFDREQRLGENGLFKKSGQAAVDARATVEGLYENKFNELTARATTRREAEMFREILGRRRQNALESIAEFTGREEVAAYRGAAGARLELATEDLGAARRTETDPEKLAQAQAAYDGVLADYHTALGLPAAMREADALKRMSDIHVTAIANMVGEDRDDEAEAYLERYATEMSEKALAEVRPRVRSLALKRQAEISAEMGGVSLSGWNRATPALLSALTRQESAGNPGAESPKGASGLRQIMPGTARDLAPRFGVDFAGMTDAEVKARLKTDTELNLAMGEAYLNDQLKAFNGNVALALAAYNAGPDRAREWERKFGRPGETVSLADWLKKVPFKETRDYVASITAKVAPPPLPADADLATTRRYARALGGGDRQAADAFEAAYVGNWERRQQEKRDQESRAWDAVQPYLQPDSNVTSWTQIPSGVWAGLSPQSQTTIKSSFAAGGRERSTDQRTYADVYAMAAADPEAFKQADLTALLPRLSASDFQEVVKLQLGMRRGEGKAEDRRTSLETTNRVAALTMPNGLKPEDEAVFKASLFRTVGDLERTGGKPLQEQQVMDLANRLAVEVATGRGLFGAGKRPLYEYGVRGDRAVGYDDIPEPKRDRIVRDFRAKHGRVPSKGEVVEAYRTLAASGVL